MFMVLSSWQSHCESSPDECRTAPSGRRPKTKSDDLGCESCIGLNLGCELPVQAAIVYIAIYYYYSAQELIFILPSHGG